MGILCEPSRLSDVARSCRPYPHRPGQTRSRPNPSSYQASLHCIFKTSSLHLPKGSFDNYVDIILPFLTTYYILVSPSRAGSSHSSARLVTFFNELEEKNSARKLEKRHFLPLRVFFLISTAFLLYFRFSLW